VLKLLVLIPYKKSLRSVEDKPWCRHLENGNFWPKNTKLALVSNQGLKRRWESVFCNNSVQIVGLYEKQLFGDFGENRFPAPFETLVGHECKFGVFWPKMAIFEVSAPGLSFTDLKDF
jgi:hypothetical protein